VRHQRFTTRPGCSQRTARRERLPDSCWTLGSPRSHPTGTRTPAMQASGGGALGGSNDRASRPQQRVHETVRRNNLSKCDPFPAMRRPAVWNLATQHALAATRWLDGLSLTLQEGGAAGVWWGLQEPVNPTGCEFSLALLLPARVSCDQRIAQRYLRHRPAPAPMCAGVPENPPCLGSLTVGRTSLSALSPQRLPRTRDSRQFRRPGGLGLARASKNQLPGGSAAACKETGEASLRALITIPASRLPAPPAALR